MIPENFRLGYACINDTLRSKNIFTSRTLKLSTLEVRGLDYAKELAIQNLKDLQTILEWNLENGIYFMRISSNIFPFASHPEHGGYSLDFANDLLKSVGVFVRDNNIRITMHPGQFNVLSSPRDTVVQNTFLDLNHHCDILDRMGLDQNSVMIIHGGGKYDSKTNSLERLEKNILKLPERTRNRLVLENCEMSYSIEDLLPISEKLQIPIVIDTHHDDINHSTFRADYYFERVFKVWHNRSIKPKMHVSNSIEGCGPTRTERRKHSDYVRYFHESLLYIDFDIDIMLECKMKEKALFKLLEMKTDPFRQILILSDED
jgi:UV DNA damage endonuclease